MPEYQIHPITDSHYELVDSLPDGKLVEITETPGTAVTRIVRGGASQDFVDYMTETHKYILSEAANRWVQVWVPGQPRLELPAQGLGIAEARWELLTPATESLLPAPGIAVPVERPGGFAWLIRPPHVQPAVVAEFTALLRRLVGDGLWRQRWDVGNDGFPLSDFNPLTPGMPLEPFSRPLVRAEAYNSPDGLHLQVRQYGGHFDEGENLLFLTLPTPRGEVRPTVCEVALHAAGWRVTGPWTRGDRGGLDAIVTAL